MDDKSRVLAGVHSVSSTPGFPSGKHTYRSPLNMDLNQTRFVRHMRVKGRWKFLPKKAEPVAHPDNIYASTEATVDNGERDEEREADCDGHTTAQAVATMSPASIDAASDSNFKDVRIHVFIPQCLILI